MDFRVDVDTWFVFSILFIGALSHLMLVYIVLPYFVRRKQISRLRVRFLNRISVNERFEKRALDHQFSDLQQRNTVLESDLRTSLQHLLHTSRTSGHYASFYAEFDLAYPDFTKKMHVIVPNITAHELKFCSLLRMNLSAKKWELS